MFGWREPGIEQATACVVAAFGILSLAGIGATESATMAQDPLDQDPKPCASLDSACSADLGPAPAPACCRVFGDCGGCVFVDGDVAVLIAAERPSIDR